MGSADRARGPSQWTEPAAPLPPPRWLAGTAPHLSERYQGPLIDGRLLDQLLVLLLKVPDPRARIPKEDHLLAHGAVLLLQAGKPLAAVVELAVADLRLLPEPLDLLLKVFLVLLQLRALLLKTLVLETGRRSMSS